MLDFSNGKAIYLQIADDICDKILMGTLEPDRRIPSVRECAATVEVNANTVMRSYEYLSSLNIIYNKRGLGFFTSADARNIISAMRKSEFLDDGIKPVFRQLHLLEVSPEQLAQMYSTYIETQKK